MKITSNREELLKSIELKIIEGNQLIELNIYQELNTYKNSFYKWREDTIELLNNFFYENSFALKFESEVIYIEQISEGTGLTVEEIRKLRFQFV